MPEERLTRETFSSNWLPGLSCGVVSTVHVNLILQELEHFIEPHCFDLKVMTFLPH